MHRCGIVDCIGQGVACCYPPIICIFTVCFARCLTIWGSLEHLVLLHRLAAMASWAREDRQWVSDVTEAVKGKGEMCFGGGWYLQDRSVHCILSILRPLGWRIMCLYWALKNHNLRLERNLWRSWVTAKAVSPSALTVSPNPNVCLLLWSGTVKCKMLSRTLAMKIGILRVPASQL